MKFFTVLALLSIAALATAAPCGHEDNGVQGGSSSNHQDNSVNSNQQDNSSNKEVKQTIGSVGSSTDHSSGLVS